ncbi:uncharacterized protein LOC129960068 [Argiope bruennichi]|uniref:PWWP domain-containing protein n=1 Tax=Argiope bruennichi TaxID=94029 RepID=A0A8T0FQ76_ARGBR|nr:uncharacterized protein LOC129960068 [Argiope bruennichi]KAF8790873.1 hypothetical protein HNY73_005826 [Argiope bruennichi]
MEEGIPVVDLDSDSSSGLPDVNDFFSDTSTFEATKLKKDDVVMEEERPVADRDSDSSSGLPDINDFFSDTSKFEAAKLKKDDVVWAEYKDLFWPAIVRNVDKKNKKVNVWYLDSVGKSFKLPFRKIRGYNDGNVYMHNFKNLENNPLDEKHRRVHTRTEHFFDRRKRGIKDNVIEFFNLSRPVFLFDEIPESSECNNKNTSAPESSEFNTENASTPESSEIKFSSDNTSAEKIEDVNVNLEKNSDTESSVKNDSDGESSVKNDSDGESSVKNDSDGESSVKNNVQNNTSADSPNVSKPPSPYSDEMVEKIVSYIQAGHLNKYLLDVFNCTIKNEKHERYMRALEKDTTRTLWFGAPSHVPISNEKLLPVTFYLYKLFEREIGSRPFRNEYIIMVWLPEAVKKAASLFNEESLQLPDDADTEVSNSLSEAKASDLLVKSVSSNVSFPVESPESTSVQLGLSESASTSSVTHSFTRPKRKLASVSSLLNDDSNTPDMEACTSKKKKSTDTKRQEVQPEVRRSLRSTTARKMAESREESLVASTPAVKASRNKASVSKM